MLTLILAFLGGHLLLYLADSGPSQDSDESASPRPAATAEPTLRHPSDENLANGSMSSALSVGVGASRQPNFFAAFEDTREYREAQQKGRREADEELKQGRATIYRFGLGMSFDSIDRKTGLPYEVIAGCMVNAEILGRASGHNDRIEEHIKAHGLPANSFKRWEKELFDLKGYCAARHKSEAPHWLSVGGPALKSPDGESTIRPVRTQVLKADGAREDGLGIVVGEDTSPRPVVEVFFDKGRSELVWGPKGSGFAVIRCHGSDHDQYMALDLRRGRWLRFELGDDRSVEKTGGEPALYGSSEATVDD